VTDAALSAPGVYLRALEPEPPGINRTAVTAFVGIAERGPLHEPQVVESYGDFVDVFGGPWGCGALAESVYGFFLNGGEEAWVVRVGRPSPIAAPTLGACPVKEDLSRASCAPILDASGDETARLHARSEGRWGNRLRAHVSAESPQSLELARLSAVAPAGAAQVEVDAVEDFRLGGTVRLVHRANAFVKSVHLVTGIDPSTRRITLDPSPAVTYPAGSVVRGPGFRLEVTDGVRREVFDGVSMNPAHPRHFVAAVNGPERTPAANLGRAGHSLLVTAEQVLGPGGTPRFKPVDAGPLAFSGGGDGIEHARGVLLDAAGSQALCASARVGGRAGNGIRLTVEPFSGRLALPVPDAAGTRDRLTVDDVRGWAIGDTVSVGHTTNPALAEQATIASVVADAHAVVLTAPLANDHPLGSTCTVAARFNLRVERPGVPDAVEPFFNLSSTAGPRYFADVVNGVTDPAVRSSLIFAAAPVALGGAPVGSVLLAGGTDPDLVPLEVLTGYASDGTVYQAPAGPERLGAAALEAVSDVSLLSVPDVVYRQDLSLEQQAFAQGQLLLHCQKMGDRFAVLDIPRARTPAEALDWPARLSNDGAAKFGALYYPWVTLAVGGEFRPVPPSGVVAGLAARSDRQDGVGRAPANVQLKGAVGIETELGDAEQGELNLAGVNCIRKFEVGALRLWGARTLSRDESALYVHGRRVVLLAIKVLTSGLRWAVFEPDDRRLRLRIKDAVEGMLNGMLVRGLIAGGRPEDAFYVKVEEAPGSSGVGEAGLVVAEIGIAVSRPAEFVVVTVRRSPDVLTLVEEDA